MTVVTELVARVVRTIREQQLFRPGDTLIVALSGGADSTALLDLLGRLPGFNLRLVAAHLNHCLRGAESDGDEEFCRRLADERGIPIEVVRVDVKQYAATEGLNLEDAGRRARIAFLEQMREKYSASAIVTAHHGDDQAETVLMRLLRGSGMTGLSGIPYRNERGYVRPLLNISRAEIEQYLTDRGLCWREDASNSDTSFLRNRIRHELLPLLEQYNPSIRSRLAATASIMADEDGMLDSLAGQVFDEIWHREEGGGSCVVVDLLGQSAALQRRLLRHAFRTLTGNLEGLNLEHIEAMRMLLNSSRPNSRLSLPQGICAIRQYDRFLLRLHDERKWNTGDEVMIPAPGIYPLPCGRSLKVEICAISATTVDHSSGRVYFDLGQTPFPWLVRTYRPGDRIIPFGMRGRKKVKDVFIDRKIPSADRSVTPLLYCADQLFWIAGLQRADCGRIGETTETCVMVALIRD